MLSLIKLRSLLIASVVAVGTLHQFAALAEPPTSLTGWHRFEFGMTVDQARRALGTSWDRDIGISPMISMHSRPTLTEFGSDSRLALDFNSDKKLFSILVQFTDSQSADNCERAYLKLLEALDAKYGAFGPGHEKDEWGIPGDGAIGHRLLMRTVALGLSGRRSRYWRRTFPANLIGLNVEAEAKRSFGSRDIEAEMYQKNGSGGCYRRVQFYADVPTKAQLEEQSKLKRIPPGMDWHWARVDRSQFGQPRYSHGLAANVKFDHGQFSADLQPDSAGNGNAVLHLTGTYSRTEIDAHVANSGVEPGGLPGTFQGSIGIIDVTGSPVTTYEIDMNGRQQLAWTDLTLAGYDGVARGRNVEACTATSQLVYRYRGGTREATYLGLMKALGC